MPTDTKIANKSFVSLLKEIGFKLANYNGISLFCYLLVVSNDVHIDK